MVNHKTYLSDLKIEVNSAINSNFFEAQIRCSHEDDLKISKILLTKEQCESVTGNLTAQELSHSFLKMIAPVLENYLFDCIADAKTIWKNE